MTTTSLGTSARTALQPPRWALGFYLRHLPLILGISLIPSAQRAAAQLWGANWPTALTVTLEILTESTRLVLLVVIYRLAISGNQRLRGLGADEMMARVAAFAQRRWPSLLIQGGLLAAAVVIFDVIPEQLIAPRVPARAQPTYWAVLLGVKNVTVIAFTFVWMIAALRQMLLAGERETSPDDPAATRPAHGHAHQAAGHDRTPDTPTARRSR